MIVFPPDDYQVPPVEHCRGMRGSPRRQQIAFGFDLLDKNGDFFAEIVEDTLLFYLFLEVGEGGYFFFEGLESLDVDFVQVVEPVGFVSFVCALSPEHIELVADVVDTLTFAIGDGVALANSINMMGIGTVRANGIF